MKNRRNLLFMNSGKPNPIIKKYGNSYVRMYKDSVTYRSDFNAFAASNHTFEAGKVVEILLLIPSGGASDETTGRRLQYRALVDTVSTFQYFGPKDNGGVIVDATETTIFDTPVYTDIKGEVLLNSDLPYDTWMLYSATCNTQHVMNSNIKMLTVDTTGLIGEHWIRGAQISIAIYRADAIDVPGKEWRPDPFFNQSDLDYEDTLTPANEPEVIKL